MIKSEIPEVSNCEIVERGFSPKGRPPVLPVETKRRRVNMISAISGQGSVRFMVYQETMNQQRLICFMERLVRASKQKMFLKVNPKFCVKSIVGENRAIFIWGGSRGIRLPPFQHITQKGQDVKGGEAVRSAPDIWSLRCYSGIRSAK